MEHYHTDRMGPAEFCEILDQAGKNDYRGQIQIWAIKTRDGQMLTARGGTKKNTWKNRGQAFQALVRHIRYSRHADPRKVLAYQHTVDHYGGAKEMAELLIADGWYTIVQIA